MTETNNPKRRTLIHNYVTNAMYEIKSQPYDILTYIDLDVLLAESLLTSILARTVEKNKILKSYITKENDSLFLYEDTNFILKEHIEYKFESQNKFDTHIQPYLNSSFSTKSKWKILVLADTSANKSRVLFKINHAYADGYQVIKILTSIFSVSTPLGQDVTQKFKRLTSFPETIYQLFIGTILLILTNIKFFITSVTKDLLSTPIPCLEEQVTEYIQCKSFELQKIKEVTKKHCITVNDFLYACMIRTDYLYTQKKRNLNTVSAINVSNTTDLNNLAPLFLSVKNNLDCTTLLQETHSIFNRCKYSAFIPFFSRFLNTVTPFLSSNLINTLYNSATNNADYMYSNIIGPDLDEISVPITNIYFATVAKNREIVFNIISCKDKVNIVCSFKKGRIEDKERFKSCIEEAYKSLLVS